MAKFRDKYRIETTRLPGWDYRWCGYYFITICTKNRQHYFGQIINHSMQLNEIGEMVQKYWFEIPLHFNNVQLDAFVVMPNHIHGIIIIHNTDAVDVETLHCNVSTSTINQNHEPNFYSHISPKPKSLSTIIRSYKSICSKMVGFSIWHPRFYEHIIRDDKSLQNIRDYIIHNPSTWNNDENNI